MPGGIGLGKLGRAMQRKARILIIEDEAAIRAGLIDVFVYHGFEVDSAEEGVRGLEMALGGTFDLILLDIMLPGMDGFEICTRIRAQDKDQAVIMLTAKTSEPDIIQGLSLGADDYVAKPFSVAELVLRVQCVLRRAGIGVAAQHHIRIGRDIDVDCRNLRARIDGRECPFTRREMEVLQYLHAHSERAVAREELLAKVWGYGRNLDIETRTVDIHIAKLRRKLERNPAQPQNIITVRGAGYRLMPEPAG